MPATQETSVELQSSPNEPAQVQSQAVAEPAPLTSDEIALEAYSLYAAGGFQDGHDLEHWLEAERLLRSRSHH